jgi:hypothetical protein
MVARGGLLGDPFAGLHLGMPQKIFISYRREDAGANALGISQYLEKEFGHRIQPT